MDNRQSPRMRAERIGQNRRELGLKNACLGGGRLNRPDLYSTSHHGPCELGMRRHGFSAPNTLNGQSNYPLGRNFIIRLKVVDCRIVTRDHLEKSSRLTLSCVPSRLGLPARALCSAVRIQARLPVGLVNLICSEASVGLTDFVLNELSNLIGSSSQLFSHHRVSGERSVVRGPVFRRAS